MKISYLNLSFHILSYVVCILIFFALLVALTACMDCLPKKKKKMLVWIKLEMS